MRSLPRGISKRGHVADPSSGLIHSPDSVISSLRSPPPCAPRSGDPRLSLMDGVGGRRSDNANLIAFSCSTMRIDVPIASSASPRRDSPDRRSTTARSDLRQISVDQSMSRGRDMSARATNNIFCPPRQGARVAVSTKLWQGTQTPARRRCRPASNCQLLGPAAPVGRLPTASCPEQRLLLRRRWAPARRRDGRQAADVVAEQASRRRSWIRQEAHHSPGSVVLSPMLPQPSKGEDLTHLPPSRS